MKIIIKDQLPEGESGTYAHYNHQKIEKKEWKYLDVRYYTSHEQKKWLRKKKSRHFFSDFFPQLGLAHPQPKAGLSELSAGRRAGKSIHPSLSKYHERHATRIQNDKNLHGIR